MSTPRSLDAPRVSPVCPPPRLLHAPLVHPTGLCMPPVSPACVSPPRALHASFVFCVSIPIPPWGLHAPQVSCVSPPGVLHTHPVTCMCVPPPGVLHVPFVPPLGCWMPAMSPVCPPDTPRGLRASPSSLPAFQGSCMPSVVRAPPGAVRAALPSHAPGVCLLLQTCPALPCAPPRPPRPSAVGVLGVRVFPPLPVGACARARGCACCLGAQSHACAAGQGWRLPGFRGGVKVPSVTFQPLPPPRQAGPGGELHMSPFQDVFPCYGFKNPGQFIVI